MRTKICYKMRLGIQRSNSIGFRPSDQGVEVFSEKDGILKDADSMEKFYIIGNHE
jgi:hypothetical protein